MKCWKMMMAGLCLAGMVGCVSPHETAGTTMTIDLVTGSAVQYEGNIRLKNRVEVTGVTYDRTVSGFNRVNVQLATKCHEQVYLQYRFAWFNVEGMEIDADMQPYQTLPIQGLDAVTVTGVAKTPEAVRARLRIREFRATPGWSR